MKQYINGSFTRTTMNYTRALIQSVHDMTSLFTILSQNSNLVT